MNWFALPKTHACDGNIKTTPRILQCQFVAVLLTTALMTAGCGGGGASGTTSTGNTTTTTSGVTTTTTSTTTTTTLSGSTSLLNVSVAGAGTVTTSAGGPGAVLCTSAVAGYTGNCSQGFTKNSTVTLHASGAGFIGWAGPALTAVGTGCAGTADCTFTKSTGTQYVTAIFASGGTSPVQLYTDITSGPTTGGENNKGIYLSVFGKYFGTTGAGTSAKVYLDNIEVDNYRSIGTSRGRSDIQQITAQIGTLGGAANGTNLPVKVVINGNVATDTNALTFKVNPGKIYFVSLTGNDSTGQPDDITHPYRHVQLTINNNTNSISSGCTIAAGLQPVATAGVWGLIVPGDFIIMRDGQWTDIHQTGDNYFLRVQNKSGTAPTGAAQTGPITLMGFPTENPQVFRTLTSNVASASGGGISGADTARNAIGCGSWVTIANLRIESGWDDGMISTQAAWQNPNGANWRVVNNEMSAYSATYNTNAKGAGLTGSGNGVVAYGNHVHDVYCGQNTGTVYLQNHGIYFDGTGSYEVAYNEIGNIFGGNGVQTYSSSGSPITNVSIHHNLIHDVNKHGINIADGTSDNVKVWDNVVYNVQFAGVRFNTTTISNARIYNNTFYGINLSGNGNYGALTNDWNFPAGAMDVQNNIFYVSTGTPFVTWNGGIAGSGTISNNLWFNGTGSISFDSAPVAGNPLFVTPGSNFHLQAASPAIGTGSHTSPVTTQVPNDYELGLRSTTTMDIGAYKY